MKHEGGDTRMNKRLENMIDSGCQMLVITAADGGSLGTVLEHAKEKNMGVFVRGRLLMNSNAVSFL